MAATLTFAGRLSLFFKANRFALGWQLNKIRNPKSSRIRTQKTKPRQSPKQPLNALKLLRSATNNVPVKCNDSSADYTRGGTVVAIAGDDFAMIAADTRLTRGNIVISRNENKLFRLTDNTIMGCTGGWGDAQSLHRLLKIQVEEYMLKNNRPPSTNALAQCTSVALYNHRFEPYECEIVMIGFKEYTKGVVYSFDCYGHAEPESYGTAGSASSLLDPVLDHLMIKPNGNPEVVELMTAERAVTVAFDLFVSASERDIFTGDSVKVNIITKNGIEEREMPLATD